MKAIAVCPSTLMPGFTCYSPHAVKTLFDGVPVSPIMSPRARGQADFLQKKLAG